MIGRAVRLRIALTMAGFAVAFVGLGLRASQLTLIDGDALSSRARRQQTRTLALAPRRGSIVDRAGEALALTRETVDVFVRPREVRAGARDVERLASALGVPVRLVAERMTSESSFVWLKRRVPLQDWARVRALDIDGVGRERARERVYPRGALAGHVVGFIGIDGQGLEGIERRFDRDLRGEMDALSVERDARGRHRVLGEEWGPLSRVGARVELTIDAGIQHVAETELENAVTEFGASAGSAIVMDPSTGEILAMANVPRFDPNFFRASGPDRWRNRAVTDVYEPGSTLKAVLAAAALRNGSVLPNEMIDCEGGRFRIGRRLIHDHHKYDLLSFSDVIANSSNIGCAKVGSRLGAERLEAAFHDFGFGVRTGVGLPGEVAGLIRPAKSWAPIDLATASFGQGVAVSPLQLVRAFAAIANGGQVMRPTIVRRVVAADGRVLLHNEPKVERRVIETDVASDVTEMLVRVVEEGTGKQARLAGFSVAGKTGTSQKVDTSQGGYHDTDRVSSFVGFVPADDPALAILVMVDTPTRGSTYGGVVAGPVFRHIAEHALGRVGVFPREDPMFDRPADVVPVAFRPAAESGGIDPEAVSGGTPRFLGMAMRPALVRAQALGWRVQVRGTGYVVSQSPMPGHPVPDGALELTFARNR